jgi:GTP cyclohydrolase II
MSQFRDHDLAPGSIESGNAEEALARIARAVDAMRTGRFVCVRDRQEGEMAALAIETAGSSALRRFDTLVAEPWLVLTHARARKLKVRIYTDDVVALPLALPLDAEQLRAIADPTADLAAPLKGPFKAARELPSQACSAAARLAKLAGLLPAVVVGPAELAREDSVSIAAHTVDVYDELVVGALKLVTSARVPLEGAENSEVAVFRAACSEPEHYAVVLGNPPTDRPVLARLHSECFTGDLLASLRCDCGSQLRGAIAAIASAGGGVLLYLAQEGRGIGLANKLRAYRLQDQGFDTLEANERLGFQGDERLYGIAARMLALLGFKSVRLLTNNPRKVEALKASGIDVADRVSHSFPANPHNRDYLRAKAQRAGHVL